MVWLFSWKHTRSMDLLTLIRLSSSGSVIVWSVSCRHTRSMDLLTLIRLLSFWSVMGLMEKHKVHGFTYFDQVFKLWVCDGVLGLMETH